MHCARPIGSFLIVALAITVLAEGVAGQASSPSSPAPPKASPQTQQRPRTSAAGRPTLVVEVTSPAGDPIGDASVTVTGPVDRAGTTNAAGTVRLTNLRAGTYRVRFEREGFVTFERDVTLRASGVTQVDVALNEAPAQTPPPEPPAPVVAPDSERPYGDFRATDVPDFVERNFIDRDAPVKVNQLGCTGYATSRLIQLREPLEDQEHADADESLYVVAGEVALAIEARGEQVLAAGTFATIPRGTTHTLTRRGRNPPILISVLSGPACEGATR